MTPATVAHMPDRSTAITADQIRAELQASTGVPVVALALLVARLQHRQFDVGGAGPLIEEWGKVATHVLAQLGTLPEIQAARKTAQRAIRIQQGYEAAAKDKGYQVLVEYLEGTRGVDRDLTDEECVALNNGLVYAFAGYGAFLDHTAGAIAGGGR